MQPSKSSSDLDRGRRVGKYEIVTRLSVGGMAELFLAFIPGPGGFKKFVALKQILPDVKADDSFVKMFLDEARITAAFNHANIGQLFDLGEDERELYLAMEFIAGQNLEQLTKRAAKREVPIPVGFAARVVRDTLLGLHYAHAFTDPTGQPMGVVHRDVSPKNVMVTWTGQVKVIDFGIAKARGRLNRTQVGVVKGTSGYMSPEQVKNEPLDGRTDLFAAAVMLHELLCGERLFAAATDALMMLGIVEGEATPPSAVNPNVTQELSDVVLKGLSKKREQRFANGREFARAIEQACPDLFEDEQVAEVMATLFEDKIAITRSLLEAANEGADQASMKQAVAGLTNAEERDADSGKKKPVRAAAGTPNPRPGLRSSSSSQRLDRVGGATSKTPRKPGTAPGKSVARLPKVADRAAPEEDTVKLKARSSVSGGAGPGEDTLPPRSRSQMKLGAVPPQPPEPAPTGELTAPPQRKRGALGAVLVGLVLLAGVGGLGWALTGGPLKDTLAALDGSPPPADTGPAELELGAAEPGPDKPAWLIEKQRQKAEQEAERRRQAEAEVAANDPERQRVLAELESQLKQLDYLEAEQRSLRFAAQQGQAAGASNSKRIEDLQKQIDDLKGAVAAKKKAPAASPGEPGEIEIVKGTQGAKQASVGYLDLRTINPSSANVLLNGDGLGSTPLSKVPLEAGVHRLVVMDGDGKARVLSVTIRAGKAEAMNGVDVGSLPYAQ
jgi:serine/threonine-protein kinase